MKNKAKYFVLLAAILLFSGCSINKSNEEPKLIDQPYSSEKFALGTYIRIRVFDEKKESALDDAFEKIDELEEKISINNDSESEDISSEVNEVNQNAGIKPVIVSNDVYNMFKIAKQYSQETSGGFNLVIGSITQLWRIGFDDARVPDQLEIQEALTKVDFEKVILNEENKSIFLEESGMILDPGAIAKGFIADEVAKVLKNNGVTSSIIDLGGNIYVFGDNPNSKNKLWTVGVQDPNQSRGTVVGTIEMTDRTIVTSGIYERNLKVENKVYHHIFDSKTGYPVENDIAGVSIITTNSMDGDILSTVLFTLGIKEGLRYIEEKTDDNTEAVFISKDNKIFVTEGLEDKFTLSNESDYKIGKKKSDI
ncbi:FAD:protein FMN transferase [Enterococcus sp.]|uniref:FAD:protein FMN transferase n=1 Tax=Enterococcus sp. TaxID=35783 RepID=UPI00290A4943|nr:FAD:protein FMN transferase [Enterococcus sp.]MDU5337297.1 FAD:protein FMN transferase [Enterococcus sp.]